MNKINKKELHELFQELHNKNQQAYNQLYEKYYKLVYGIVFSIIKNKNDSEDVSHEIFTKIYKLDSKKLPNDHEASWLFTVCKNESLLFLRKFKPNISIEEIYELPENNSEIDTVLDIDYYNRIISGLKEDEKMIVSLKVLSNFTFRKISQIMNIPIGTVQWKYYNAINSLKISLGSLVGAALAFILVIARGNFKMEKEFFENDRVNYTSENEKMDGIKDENQTTSEIQSEENEIIDEEKSDENSTIAEKNEIIYTEIQNKENLPIKKYDKLDGIQIGFLSIGIALLLIFLIFFKKYQQKLKFKSSK